MSSPDTLRLHILTGGTVGKELEVTDELVIGRGAEGEGRLEEDTELSRLHARVMRMPSGGFAIEDLGSTNGTLLNGARVEGTRPLQSGDRIELGGTTLVVDIGAPPTVAATPAAPEAPPTEAPPTEAPPTAPEAPAQVALRLEMDLAAREARLALDEGSDEVKLVNRNGRWEILPAD
jgi:pSer/pThr/pTyr-binding forkhead associated (FHA) protein